MDSPVALLIFNRPDHTARVLAEIARARPSRLFVVADGPRRPGDVESCAAARALIDRVDWDCEVSKHYSDHNLGCKVRVQTGLSWVFDQVDQAIVLEDDCLPHVSFFRFCDELLEHYWADTRVMTISGTNFFGSWQPGLQSYHFSLFPATWGWATWKRAWDLYDADMDAWPRARDEGLLESLFPDRREQDYWATIFAKTHEGAVDTWDYQLLLSCWVQHSCQIIPSVNLVSNIGFGPDATHTSGSSGVADLPSQDIEFPLRHPRLMLVNRELDRRTQEQIFNPKLSFGSRVRAKARVLGHRR